MVSRGTSVACLCVRVGVLADELEVSIVGVSADELEDPVVDVESDVPSGVVLVGVAQPILLIISRWSLLASFLRSSQLQLGSSEHPGLRVR